MSKLTGKILVAAAFAVTMSVAHAEVVPSNDGTLLHAAQDALHRAVFTPSIRVQAIDGVVYLYGRTSTYPARLDIENAVKSAVPGHDVVSLIADNGCN